MIKGKVADIIDSRTLALNIGQQDGVELNMRFNIIGSGEKKIIDPDTQEEIGVLSIPKFRVKVFQVEEKFCLARTYTYETINEGGSLTAFSKLLQPPKLVRKYETFKIDGSTSIEIDEANSAVKIGDIAEEIIDVVEE